MKKPLIILPIISTILLVLSFMLYTSASSIVNDRFSKLDKHILNPQPEQSDAEQESISKSVYENIYGLSNITTDYPSGTFFREPEKVVYLTIDDGPDPKSTPLYLDVLKQHGVKATFFMIGSLMEKHPRLVLDISSQGHAIGNHSYTHNYGSLYANAENFTQEIRKTEEIIYSITGKRSKIFRAPGGSNNIRNPELIDELKKLGYVYFDWNVSAADTDPTGVTRQEVIDNIKRESRYQKKVMVLMHDNHRRTASLEALPEVIEWFKENGYTFGTLNGFIEPMHLKRYKKKSEVQPSVTEAVYSS